MNTVGQLIEKQKTSTFTCLADEDNLTVVRERYILGLVNKDLTFKHLFVHQHTRIDGCNRTDLKTVLEFCWFYLNNDVLTNRIE